MTAIEISKYFPDYENKKAIKKESRKDFPFMNPD